MLGPLLTTWDATSDGFPYDRLSQAVDAWIRSPALLDLVEVDSDEIPVHANTFALLDWLLAATSSWDIRHGRERNLARPDQPLTKSRASRVLAAATTLGLREAPPPTSTTWDTVLVLGGRLGACLSRVAYALQLAERGRRGPPGTPISSDVVALTTRRPLDHRERALAADLGIDAQDEYEAMSHLLADSTTLGDGSSQDLDKVTETYADGAVRFIPVPGRQVVAVPSTKPKRRADTYDTLTWWAQQQPLRRTTAPGQILVVTSSIYATYQGLVALRVLGLRHQLRVETIGVPADVAIQFPDTATIGPAHYLQELRATLQAAQLALDEAAGSSAP